MIATITENHLPVPAPEPSAAARMADAAELNARLGELLADGRAAEAEQVARRSLQRLPENAEAGYGLGCALYAMGRREEAIGSLRAAVARHPYLVPAWDALANLLAESGRLDDALAASFALEEHVGGLAANRARIGTLLLRQGDHEGARAWLDRALNSLLPERSTRQLPYGTVTLPRLVHDAAQLEYLVDRDILGDDLRPVLDEYRRLATAAARAPGHDGAWQLDRSDVMRIAPFYRRVLHLADGSRVSGGSLNPRLDWGAIQRDHLDQPDPLQCTVIDDLLSAEALAALLRYSLESTIWHNDGQKGRNYLGAYQGTGFSCQIVEQIADELQRAAPAIFGDLPLSQVWAYRHVMGAAGIGTHADFAVVNVNLWITPDEANLDPASGGLVVYEAAAAGDASFDDYNEDHDQIARSIAGARKRVIPYRQNRAMIFNSRLYHSTDEMAFRSDYASRRINVTLLFGER